MISGMFCIPTAWHVLIMTFMNAKVKQSGPGSRASSACKPQENQPFAIVNMTIPLFKTIFQIIQNNINLRFSRVLGWAVFILELTFVTQWRVGTRSL